MNRIFPEIAHCALVAISALLFAGCNRDVPRTNSIPPDAPSAGVDHYAVEVVHAWPHDVEAFTEGLFFRNGELFESTGLNGRSSVREVQLSDGKVLKAVSVPAAYFGEGIAAIGSKLYQLTWKAETGFIYDVDTFQKLGEFKYTGEGWGLTTDGKLLIMSDGTSKLRFIDPNNFSVARTIDVRLDGDEVQRLNELEYIRGDIFANVWQTDRILRIDAADGRVRAVIDCAGLLPRAERTPQTDVLNGIAYDPATDRLMLTGKFWPKIFEVRLKPVTAIDPTAPVKKE